MNYVNPSELLKSLEVTVESLTGLPAEYLRRIPIDELRHYAEARHGEPMRVTGIATRIINVLGEKIRVLG